MSPIPEITVAELKALLDTGHTPFLLDVRRPEESEIATLGGTVVPLPELPDRFEELEAHKNEDIIIYCRSGSRSGQATAFLQSVGFSNVRNLKGGVLAWSREIDPTMPTY